MRGSVYRGSGSEVDGATGIVGQQHVAPRIGDTVQFALENAFAHLRRGQRGEPAETAADLRFLERQRRLAGEALNEQVDARAGIIAVGRLAESVRRPALSFGAIEAAVGQAARAVEPGGEVVHASSDRLSALQPLRIVSEETRPIIADGDHAARCRRDNAVVAAFERLYRLTRHAAGGFPVAGVEGGQPAAVLRLWDVDLGSAGLDQTRGRVH